MDRGTSNIPVGPTTVWKTPSNPWKTSSSPSNAWNVTPPAVEPCSLASVMDEEYARELQKKEEHFTEPVPRLVHTSL